MARKWSKRNSRYTRADIDAYGKSQVITVRREGASCPFALYYWDGKRDKKLSCHKTLKSAVRDGNRIFGK